MFVLALIAYDLFIDAFRTMRRLYRDSYLEYLLATILVVFSLLVMSSVYMYLWAPKILSGWKQLGYFYPTDIYALYLMGLNAAVYITYYYLDKLVLSRTGVIAKRINER